MDLKLLKMLCKDSKQHHVIFHELYSVSSLLCIAQNVRFEIPYKVLYFETPFLMIFKYYAWASYAGITCAVLHKSDFEQHLFQINLLMYTIFLIAILYKSYILFSSNVSCISIIYLHRSIILIVWLSVINRYKKIHLLLNLDYFTCLIITNGER